MCTFDDPNSGNIAGSDVTINVSCTTTQYDVNINVTGLAATNSVSFTNGADTATFNADGIQTISTLDDESAYDVDITVQPDTPNQVCTFDTADSGTIAGSDVTINVSCTTTQYDVNINVTGLAATNSVSFSNGADSATFNADGTQTISTLDDESAYNLAITAQPDTPDQVCTFDDPNSGALAGADVTINVSCTTTQYNIDINVSGLAATNSVSFSNGADIATFNADGLQTISTLDDESAYDVDITIQPDTPNQVCTFDTADSGTIAGSDITINVSCTTTQYDVNIAVTGLATTNSVSFSNGADSATFNADGTQTISTLDDESAYSLAITAQPDTPNQVCTFDDPNSGTLAGADVTINVSCTTTQYDVNINVTGLAATNSVSFSNGADTATFNADGTQNISTLDDESAYNLAITAQPDTPNQVCTFENPNSGTLAGADVTVNVTCVTTQYDVNIAVTGLAATNSVSFSNGVDTVTFNADGTQTISTLDDESAFNVAITAQPNTPDQVCTFDDPSSGTLAGSDVTVNVTCVTTKYDVNIAVTGLAATNSVSFSNGADTATFNVDGTQTISTLDDESAYNLAITAQPDSPNQVCTFDDPNSGTLAGADVTVNVTCVTTQYDVNIAVTGLAATNSVSFSNGADTATFNADGSQTISTLDDESAYSLAITAQPDTPDQVCTFDDPNSGALAGADVTVNVTCVTTQYNVGVTVSGLAPGNSVVLQNNGGDDLTVNADGSVNFATALDDGSAYAATVLTQPTTPNQTCVITAPTGNLTGNDVNLTVTCTINSYAINVDVTGLATDNEVILQNNAGDDLTIDADGISTFATALLDETDYEVTVLTQPTTPNQTCVLENPTGTLAGADVVDITLTCTINQYDINLNVAGLALSNSVGFSNGSDTLNFITNGTQTISSLDDESAFDVDITFQPDTPNQICTFIDPDAGVLAGEDITINVACITVQYTVGVNVMGLASGNSVVLQNNATDDLSVNADGISTFATPLDDGSAFNVTVLTQPTSPNQTCVVTNPSGNLNGSNVTLDVTCTTEQYTVSANVTGLAAGNDVVLQNNGGDDLTVNADGLNAFVTALDDESAYAVTVLTQPTTPSQTCEVTDGTGNLAGTDVTVDVNCSIDQYTISVDVSGLAVGNDVVLQNNAGDDLTISTNGSSTFATALDDETGYLVSVLTQPTDPNQTCVLSNESGTLAGADVTDVTLVCTTEQYDITLNVTGLLATNSVSFENGTDATTFNADGSQTITTADDGTAYDIDITAQPDTPDQLCTFDDPDTGDLSGADVTITVTCEIVAYDIEVDVTGLAAGNSVTLQNNGGDDLVVSSNGISTFFTPLDDETDYAVTVLTQPTSPNQTCVVTDGAGTVAGDDVTDITVTCTTETYFVGGYVTGMLNVNEVVLENNGTEMEIVGCDGPFVFETPQDDLSAYDVTIVLNPESPPQVCQVFFGDDIIDGDDVTNVEVVCAATTSTDYIFADNFDCVGFTPPN